MKNKKEILSKKEILNKKETEKETEKEKYIACFLLHALGDTIGYKNSIWEFNYNIENYNDSRETIEIISEFIKLGGITDINLSGWLVSDDTLINYEIGKFILNIKDKMTEKNILDLKDEIIGMFNYQVENDIERGFGVTTVNAIQKWTDHNDERYTKYNETSGGSGCTMRTFPIGLRYYKDEDIDKLIDLYYKQPKVLYEHLFAGYHQFVSEIIPYSLIQENNYFYESLV